MTIIGHKKILSLLDRSIERNNVAQSYIFSGPEGLGKFVVAFNFAEKLTEADLISSPQAGSWRINPDLIVIEPEIEEKKGIKKKKQIKIEKIRELRRWLSLSSSGSKKRVAIIDDAHWLNISAQNALLKTLEEPHENAVIILVAADEKKFLPTILSRCQKIKFGPVSDDELKKSLPKGVANEEEIIFWSLGRPGLLLELTKNKEELELRRESVKELNFLLEKNMSDKFSLAENICKDTVLLTKKMNFWLVVLRKSLSENFSGIKVTSPKAVELIDRISQSLELIRGTNANPRLLMENLFLYF